MLAAPAVVEHLVNRARPFIYDTGLAPAAAAGALAALGCSSPNPSRARVGCERVARAGRGARRRRPAGAVLSVPMPARGGARRPGGRARPTGVRVGCFRPPSVPDGVSRLRMTASAGLTDDAWARRDGRRAAASGVGGRHARAWPRVSRVVVVTGTDTGVGKTVVDGGPGGGRSSGRARWSWSSPCRRAPAARRGGDAAAVTGSAAARSTSWSPSRTRSRRRRPPGCAASGCRPCDEHADRIRALAGRHDTVVVEGAGGVLVRLDSDGGTILDLAAALPDDPGGRRGGGRGRARHAEPHGPDRRGAPRHAVSSRPDW